MRRRDGLKTSGIFAAACAGLFLVLTGSSGASPVSAPTSLAASAVSSSQINLTWVDTNSNETGYLVERSLSSSSGFVQIASLPANTQSYSNTGLAAATTYYYQVRAAHSGAFSPYSNVASARTLSSAPTATPPPPTPTRTPTPGGPTPTRTPTPSGSIPAAPSNLTAAAISSTQISLAWTDNSNNETAFRVERAPASAGPWTYIGATTLTGYGDSGLAASTTYFYRVAAYNTAGTSAYTNTASAATQAASGVPAAPSGLVATSVSSSQINLTWVDASTNETGFKIERSTSTVPWAQIGTTGTNVTSYSSTGLSASTAYSYRVRANNTAGDSAYSNTASATTSAGGTVWTKWYQGSGSYGDSSRAVVVDGSGNVVVAGQYQGVVNFGTGLITSYTNATTGPTVDAFVAKYSPSGTPVWSRGIGGDASDSAYGVAADVSGNVVVTGYQGSTAVDYGGGMLGTRGGTDIFVAKYSSTGGYVWAKTVGGTGSDLGAGVAVDGAGNVFVTGYMSATVDFGGGSLVSAGSLDAFLVKYSSAGAHVWSKRIGGTTSDQGTGVAVDGSGNVFVVGNFTGTVDFGAGPVTSAGSQDIFVIKYSSTGAYIWSKQFGGTGLDNLRGVAVDGNGDVFVTGDFLNTISFGGPTLTCAGGSIEADVFLAKLSGVNGSHLWSKSFGDGDAVQSGYALAVDGAGNVAVTGYYGGSIDFGGGALPYGQLNDIFVAKFNSLGTYISSRRYGDPPGLNDNQFGNAIAMSSGGNVYIAGEFTGTLDFGAGGSATSTAYGGTDAYLASIGP